MLADQYDLAVSIGAVHLEALMRARVCRGEAHIVEHRAGVKELAIEAEATALTGKWTSVIHPAGMVK